MSEEFKEALQKFLGLEQSDKDEHTNRDLSPMFVLDKTVAYLASIFVTLCIFSFSVLHFYHRVCFIPTASFPSNYTSNQSLTSYDSISDSAAEYINSYCMESTRARSFIFILFFESVMLLFPGTVFYARYGTEIRRVLLSIYKSVRHDIEKQLKENENNTDKERSNEDMPEEKDLPLRELFDERISLMDAEENMRTREENLKRFHKALIAAGVYKYDISDIHEYESFLRYSKNTPLFNNFERLRITFIPKNLLELYHCCNTPEIKIRFMNRRKWSSIYCALLLLELAESIGFICYILICSRPNQLNITEEDQTASCGPVPLYSFFSSPDIVGVIDLKLNCVFPAVGTLNIVWYINIINLFLFAYISIKQLLAVKGFSDAEFIQALFQQNYPNLILSVDTGKEDFHIRKMINEIKKCNKERNEKVNEEIDNVNLKIDKWKQYSNREQSTASVDQKSTQHRSSVHQPVCTTDRNVHTEHTDNLSSTENRNDDDDDDDDAKKTEVTHLPIGTDSSNQI